MRTPKLREAVAVFSNPEQLEQAVSDLQSHGFDRADISFLAHEALSGAGESRGVAQRTETRREAAVTDTDIRQERMLGTSLAATIAAFAAAGFTVATGGALAAAAAAAVVAGGGVGVVGTAIGQKLGEDEAAFLDEQLARGGVLLWVRLGDRVAESRALAVLHRYSDHVRVHEVAADPHQTLPSDRT
jgi:hypothetical protein